jgi:hypothetical protein
MEETMKEDKSKKKSKYTQIGVVRVQARFVVC